MRNKPKKMEEVEDSALHRLCMSSSIRIHNSHIASQLTMSLQKNYSYTQVPGWAIAEDNVGIGNFQILSTHCIGIR